jgi:hypothetical protein
MSYVFGRSAMAPWGARGPFMGQLKYFDVPTGAFPVPWGPEDNEEERQQRYGMGSRHALGQYEYETYNNFEKTQKAYNDAMKSRDPGAIDKAFADYKDAYDKYVEETPLRDDLEKLFQKSKDASFDEGGAIRTRDAAKSEAERKFGEEQVKRAHDSYKDAVAKMEELWPGWYQSHWDWIVYERTGGQPDWYIDLKDKGAWALEQAMYVLPFLHYAGGFRASVPRFVPPRIVPPTPVRPTVPTPSGAGMAPRPMVPTPRFPIVNVPPKAPVVPPQVATPSGGRMVPSLVPGGPPSGGGGIPMTPTPGGRGAGGAGGVTPGGSEFMKEFEKILPGRPPVATPSGGPPLPPPAPAPSGGPPPVATPGAGGPKEFVRWPAGLLNKFWAEIPSSKDPMTGEVLYDKRIINKLLTEMERPALPPTPTPSGSGAAAAAAAGFGTPPPQVEIPEYIQSWTDPASGKKYYNVWQIQEYIRGKAFRPSGFQAPRAGKLEMPPSKPIGQGIPTVPLPPVPSIDTRMAMPIPTQGGGGVSTQTAAGGMPSYPPIATPGGGGGGAPMVATQGGGAGQCPPGQFWDGRQCRGSIAPGAAGLISAAGGLGPSGPGAAPYSPVQLKMGMGMRYRVMNLI